MKLPIYQTDDKNLTLLQTNWSTAINPVLSLPINQGQVLKNVSLAAGVTNVNHLLSRKLQGWFLVRLRGQAVVWDSQDSNSMPDVTLILNSTNVVSVDIFVF